MFAGIFLSLLILFILFKLIFSISFGLAKGVLVIALSLICLIVPGILFTLSIPLIILFCIAAVFMGLLKLIF